MPPKPNENQLKTKNKKSGKVKKKKSKKNTGGTNVKLPSNASDFSSNWKNLLTKIEPQQQSNKKKPKKAKESKETKPADIWFDDVDPDLLEPEPSTSMELKVRPQTLLELKFQLNICIFFQNASGNLVKEKSFQGITKILAMDCEMVGTGYLGKDSILARISIVNQFGHCIYDKYVKATEKVTDYRTKVSGIRPQDLASDNAEDFKVVQKEASEMFQNRILVGHSIKNDLKVLFLDHPRKHIRDTAEYKPFRKLFGGRTPSLKNLTARLLGVKVQEGEHSSVQDAQATMRVYTMHKKQWENELKEKNAKKFAPSKKAPKEGAFHKRIQTDKKRQEYEDSDSE